jgi:hypothetical protein
MMDYKATASTLNDTPCESVREPGIATTVRCQEDIIHETFNVLSTLNEFLFGEKLGEWKEEDIHCMEENIKMNTEKCNIIRARAMDIYERLSK